MSEYFDELETLEPAERESRIFADMPEFLGSISSKIKGWNERLAGIDVSTITSREALATLPVLRKPELMEAQVAEPPFGGFVDESLLNGSRIFKDFDLEKKNL